MKDKKPTSKEIFEEGMKKGVIDGVEFIETLLLEELEKAVENEKNSK